AASTSRSALVEAVSGTTSTRAQRGASAARSRSASSVVAGTCPSWPHPGRGRGRLRSPAMTAEPSGSSEPDLDPHTTAGKLADLERRYDEAVHAGSARAVEKQHAKGKM